ISALLDVAPPAIEPPSIEELLVLRRLVLEPLLDASPDARSLPIARLAARALGYALHGPAPLEDGDAAFALVPADPSRPTDPKGAALAPRARGALGAIVRARGVRGAVVEVPHARRDGVRDFGIRVASALRADAIVVGLARHEGYLTGDAAFREAHALATTPTKDREARVVVVRGEGTDVDRAGVVALGRWGGAHGEALS